MRIMRTRYERELLNLQSLALSQGSMEYFQSLESNEEDLKFSVEFLLFPSFPFPLLPRTEIEYSSPYQFHDNRLPQKPAQKTPQRSSKS